MNRLRFRPYPIANLSITKRDVRFWPKADMSFADQMGTKKYFLVNFKLKTLNLPEDIKSYSALNLLKLLR